ncbi:MAG: site-2 protease family protein [Bacteroidia bacterium]|nr:site-2 protease family protein [Bacteroidia bacterium]
MENTEQNNQNEFESTENTGYQQHMNVLPKPILEQDTKNWVRKSIISLAIYAIFFYFIFNQDLIYIAAVLVVLMIHEMGHFFAMKAFNYSNVKLFVLPMLGAYVTGKKSIISQRQMSIVILAGPLPGIVIGFCLLMSTIFYPNERLEMLGNIFFVLNLFNLLPFMPLDGGRLLETLFINHNHTIRVIFTILSIIVLAGLSIATKSIIFLIIPVSMVFDLIMEIKNQKIRDYLAQENINYTTDYVDLPDRDYWTIRDCVLLSFSKRYPGIEAGVQKYSLLEGGIIQHVTAVLKTPFIKDVKTLEKIAIMFTYILFLIVLPITYALMKFIE